jgi:hypothetical protein
MNTTRHGHRCPEFFSRVSNTNTQRWVITDEFLIDRVFRHI